MLIALLAVLGVNLAVVVALAAIVLARRLWVRQQPGAFGGAIRVAEGEIDGFGPRWRRGYGRWVRDVLVWSKGPFFFRNELLPSDGLDARPHMGPSTVKRLGGQPSVIRLRTAGATAEVAAREADDERLRGPYAEEARVTTTA